MGIGIQVEGLTKSFGPQRIWEDITFDLLAGVFSVVLGPSGTGKSVFLKSLIGLLRPEGQAVGRRQARLREIMHTLPPAVQEAIRDDLEGAHRHADDATARHPQLSADSPTVSIPTARGRVGQ